MAKSPQNQFWKQFARTAWEKKPVLKKNFVSSVRELDAGQIFSMLVTYSDHCRRQNKTDGFKFYVDGMRQHDEEILQILPVQSDKTLLGYHKRMEEMFPDYCLVCDELLQVSQNNWQRLQDFTRNLFLHVGLPNRFVEMGLYLGNYRQTPFGVHVDGCGVFSFPVVGEKIFRLWDPEFVRKNPELDRADEYSRFKKNSQTLKASAGDMTYWPSSAWHIAESDGSFSVTWSLGVWVDRTAFENIEFGLRPLLQKKIGQSGLQTMQTAVDFQKVKLPVKLPAKQLRTVHALDQITKAEWHDQLLNSWMEIQSKLGFKNFPALKTDVNISMKSRIQLIDSKGLLWARLKSKPKTVYAFHGKLIETQNSPQLEKLLQALRAGKICEISDFLKGAGKSKDLLLLQKLAKAGAFMQK